MNLDQKLNDARQKVLMILKDQMKVYLSLMGGWFRGKMTKEDFDSQARDLFTDNTVKVHNEFLLAMLNKCQSVSTTLGNKDMNRLPIQSPPQAIQSPPQAIQSPPQAIQSPPQAIQSPPQAIQSPPQAIQSPPQAIQSPPQVIQRQKSVKKKPFVKTNFTQRFQPGNQLRQVRAMVSPPSATTKSLFVSGSQGLLPDPAMIEGWLCVAAWQVNLDNVQSEIHSLISYATESLLKNLISHVVSSRRGYQVSRTAKVKQYIGIDVPLIYLSKIIGDDSLGQNPILKAQQEEADTVQSLARAGHMTASIEPITPHDMFTTLQSKPDVIGSFSAYTLAIERISTRLYHRESTAEPQLFTSSRKHRLLSIAPSPS